MKLTPSNLLKKAGRRYAKHRDSRSKPQVALPAKRLFQQAARPTIATMVISHFQWLSPVLAAIVFFGLPANLSLLGYVFWLKWQVPPVIVGSAFLAIQWCWIGCLLTWYYEARLIPSFWADLEASGTLDQESVASLSKGHRVVWGGIRSVGILIWAILPLATFVVLCFAPGQVLFPVFPGPWFWAWCLGVFLAGIATGEGFAGVVMMLRIIRDCVSQGIRLDPYHPDGLGGLSSFGRLAIYTTSMFSSGSLFIPILVLVSTYSSLSLVTVYVLIGLFSIAIAAAFIIPTVLVSSKAALVKQAMFRSVASQVAAAAKKDCSARDTAECLNLLCGQGLLADIRRMRVYPFDPWIMSQLFASVLLPVVVAYLQHVLGLK